MKQPKYQRILIKLSGEALADQSGHGIDFETVKSVCEKIKDCADRGTQIAIVVGAGNFWRGRQGSDMDRAKADHMGMLATMMNCIALGDALEKAGAQTVVFAATEMPKFGRLTLARRHGAAWSRAKSLFAAAEQATRILQQTPQQHCAPWKLRQTLHCLPKISTVFIPPIPSRTKRPRATHGSVLHNCSARI